MHTPPSLNSTAVVAATTITEFVDRGYVIVPDTFTKADVAAMRATIAAAVHARTIGTAPVGDRHIGPTTTRYAEQFTQCLNLWEDHPHLESIMRDPRLAATAAKLLGVDCVRVFQDQALFKASGGAPTYAHQDIAYWPMASAECVTAWIPLSPTGSTLDTGAMGYVAGSHRSGHCAFADIAHVDDQAQLEANEAALLAHPAWRGESPTYVEADVGSVVWHHGRTVHRALPNISGGPREVFTIVYFADGIVRGSVLPGASNVPHFVTDSPPSERVAVGQPLASARMPVVYEKGNTPPRARL